MAVSKTFYTESADETNRFGIELGKRLVAGSVVALSGDLGAGKTTLTQGIAVGLGINERVTSPTYTLVNEYEIAIPHEIELDRLIHIDSYRLGESDDDALAEAETFGMDELLDDHNAVIVIEWAERLRPVLPSDHLWISLTAMGSDVTLRELVIRAAGPHSLAILHQL